jgi:methionyl-tRNA formyltransferase
MDVVFFGTSKFAANVLSYLSANPICTVVAVVTRPDRPQGRRREVQGSAVKKWFEQAPLKCPLFQPSKASTEEFAGVLDKLQPDLFIVVAYGEIIKQRLLDLPKHGCINIHASLLPKYRGAAPIQRAIMDGERETGITIIEMVEALDAGPILNQEIVKIGGEDTYANVEEKLMEAACRTLILTLQQIHSGCVKRILQPEGALSYASKVLPEEERINWNRTAQEVHNQIRAFSPIPGAWCQLQLDGRMRRLKILQASPVDLDPSQSSCSPGTIVICSKDEFVIACKSGGVKILQAQLAGKRPLATSDLLSGLHGIKHMEMM